MRPRFRVRSTWNGRVRGVQWGRLLRDFSVGNSEIIGKIPKRGATRVGLNYLAGLSQVLVVSSQANVAARLRWLTTKPYNQRKNYEPPHAEVNGCPVAFRRRDSLHCRNQRSGPSPRCRTRPG